MCDSKQKHVNIHSFSGVQKCNPTPYLSKMIAVPNERNMGPQYNAMHLEKSEAVAAKLESLKFSNLRPDLTRR